MTINRPVLERWKQDEGRNWKWVARQLSVTPETLYHQLAGRCGLSLRSAIRLEEITGIPIRALVCHEEDHAHA